MNSRQAILARRARFVAAALATLSAGCGKGKAPPADAGAPVADQDAGARPQACLSPPRACLSPPKSKCTCQPGDPLCSCL